MTPTYDEKIRARCVDGEFERFINMLPSLFGSRDITEDPYWLQLDRGAIAILVTSRRMWGSSHPLGRIKTPPVLSLPPGLIVRIWRLAAALPRADWDSLAFAIHYQQSLWETLDSM